MVSEFLDEAVRAGESYVIRAQPTGMPRGVASLSSWVELLVDLRHLLLRDRTWTVLVRRKPDDPFGVVIITRSSSTRSAPARESGNWRGRFDRAPSLGPPRRWARVPAIRA